jgi:tetratricopeptide (TPR) repeat protein
VAQPSPYGYPEALTWFAKALGSARSGDTAGTRAAVAELAKLRDGLEAKKETYWTEQVRIQHDAAAAWLAFAEGRQAEALAAMQAAAALEDKTEKAAVTPGPLAPARELVGEMLLQMNRPADALEAFEATLKHEPNRFRALLGASRAASQAGDTAKARTYADQLVQICARADTPARTELAEARKLISKGP